MMPRWSDRTKHPGRLTCHHVLHALPYGSRRISGCYQALWADPGIGVDGGQTSFRNPLGQLVDQSGIMSVAHEYLSYLWRHLQGVILGKTGTLQMFDQERKASGTLRMVLRNQMFETVLVCVNSQHE